MALFAKKLFDINFLNMETPIAVQKFQIDEYHQTYQLLGIITKKIKLTFIMVLCQNAYQIILMLPIKT